MKSTTITRKKVLKENKITHIFTESLSGMSNDNLKTLTNNIVNKFGKKIEIVINFSRGE